MNKRTIRAVTLSGKRVMVRVDFNVPLADGAVSDDSRILAALPTITYLLDGGASVILCTHLGRPKAVDPQFSTQPVAARLAQLIHRPVKTVSDVVGPEALAAAESLEPGEIMLLENTRFEEGERRNDPKLASLLASMADVYVNDAFGSAHRAHASTEGVAWAMRRKGAPAIAGFLMEKELDYLGGALENPAHPFLAIIGGDKISGKIDVIDNLLGKVDALLVGGGMANTFLKALGLEVGDSLVEHDRIEMAREIMDRAGEELILPTDVVIADAFAADAHWDRVTVEQVTAGWWILDIGLGTVSRFGECLAGAKTVVWNGPMGVFEFPRFAEGTLAVAQLLAEITIAGGRTIIGGGNSAAAVRQLGLADQMSHISTGGGASLEFLGGATLPGVAALDDR